MTWVNPFGDPVFEVGSVVTCVNAEGAYRLAEGNTYKVLAYDPEERCYANTYTWPAYVRVRTGKNSTAYYHARRFKKS